MNNENLAMEMLRELKSQSKRWFVISIIELVIIIGSNIGWLIYQGQFETIDEQEQCIEDIDNSQDSNYSQIIN